MRTSPDLPLVEVPPFSGFGSAQHRADDSNQSWCKLYCVGMLPVYLSLVLALLCLAQLASAHVRAVLDDKNTILGTIKFADIEIAYKLYDLPRATDAVDKDKDIPTAVFLHGMKFDMITWEQLGTLEKVRAAGIRAMAIDLPGYGKTRALPYSDNNMRAELLKTVLAFAETRVNSTLHLIAPSMSGRYAVPFLDRHGTLLTSWVAIAPVGLSDWGGPWEDTHNRVCMLALYGDRDPLKKDMAILSKVFKHAYQVVLPDAGHACYQDQPEAFHRVLINFLNKCHRTIQGEPVVKPDNEVRIEM